MAEYQLDRELMFAMPIFVVGSLVSLGLVSSDPLPVDLTMVLFEAGNVELTIARAGSIAALLYVYGNRDVGFTDFDGVDAWVVYATGALVLAPPLFPAFADTVAQQPAAILAFLTQTAGFSIVSYMN